MKQWVRAVDTKGADANTWARPWDETLIIDSDRERDRPMVPFCANTTDGGGGAGRCLPDCATLDVRRVAGGACLTYGCFLGDLLAQLSGGAIGRTAAIVGLACVPIAPLALLKNLSALKHSSMAGLAAVAAFAVATPDVSLIVGLLGAALGSILIYSLPPTLHLLSGAAPLRSLTGASDVALVLLGLVRTFCVNNAAA